MNLQTVRRLAWTSWAVTMTLVVAGETTNVIGPRASFSDFFQFYPASVASATVGLLIVVRRPQNRVGWLLSLIGLLYAVWSVSASYAAHAPAANWLASWGWFPSEMLVMGVLPLLFPNGRLPSRRWRPVLWLAAAGLAAVVFVAIGRFPAPVSRPIGGLAQGLFAAAQLLFLACLVLSVSSLVVRYRHAGLEERQQLKWFINAVALVVVLLIGALGSAMLNHSPFDVPVLDALIHLSFAALPVAVGIAVLKYRLYDIDLVINKALLFATLAIFITAVYVGIVAGIGTLVGTGGQPNLALSIIATAVVAVAFQPVRDRVQRFANRIVYGRRATPYEVLSRFSERVAQSYAAEDVLPRMARVLADGTGASTAEVWLRVGSELRAVAVYPEEMPLPQPRSITERRLPPIAGRDRAVPVMHQGDLLGALTVTKRPGEAVTPVEEKLLSDLALQTGLVLRNVGLTTELMRRLEELRASRQRLVTAQDAERRRLERNLHDGAQQNLVALKVKLGLAQTLADQDPAKARRLLSQLQQDADQALETLRELARGIYPPLLAEKGLVAALAAQARKWDLPLELDACGVARYAAEVEGAVYFCCLEAFQNTVRHAHASTVRLRLGGLTGSLDFEMEDDGAGFDPQVTPRGSGLQNMSDRLEALGGSLEIRSAPGNGTTVRGTVPIAVPAVTG